MPPIPAAKSAPGGSFFARYQVQGTAVPGNFYCTTVDFLWIFFCCWFFGYYFLDTFKFWRFFFHVRWRENPSPLFLVRFACYFMLPFDQNTASADLRLPTSTIFSSLRSAVDQSSRVVVDIAAPTNTTIRKASAAAQGTGVQQRKLATKVRGEVDWTCTVGVLLSYLPSIPRCERTTHYEGGELVES